MCMHSLHVLGVWYLNLYVKNASTILAFPIAAHAEGKPSEYDFSGENTLYQVLIPHQN